MPKVYGINGDGIFVQDRFGGPIARVAEGAREARDDDDDEQEGHPSPSRGPGVDGGG